jgi:hypothetical protein
MDFLEVVCLSGVIHVTLVLPIILLTLLLLRLLLVIMLNLVLQLIVVVIHVALVILDYSSIQIFFQFAEFGRRLSNLFVGVVSKDKRAKIDKLMKEYDEKCVKALKLRIQSDKMLIEGQQYLEY